MGGRSKFTEQQKHAAVMEVLDGKCSQTEAARRIGADESTLRCWLAGYRSSGAGALQEHVANKHYSLSTKLKVVRGYLSGGYSQQEVCLKHGIRSKTQLRAWLKAYNDGTLKETRAGGMSRVKDGRKTTYEERVEIVEYCIAQGKNYRAAAEKYGVSYTQIYSWVNKYEQQGACGLVDRRGRAKPVDEMTDVERLRAELRLKEAELERARVENMFLKKVEEIERRWEADARAGRAWRRHSRRSKS